MIPDKLLKLMAPEDRAKLGRKGMTGEEGQAIAAAKSESEMQATVQQYCDLHGWPCYRSRTDKRSTGRIGTPDLLICLPFTRGIAPYGLFIGIECKMKGNKPTTEQAHELERIMAAHGETLVAYSAQEAINFLKALARP